MHEVPAAKRKYFLDNIRSLTIILVVVYHVAYIFNSAGVVSNIPVRGIPAMDVVCYFLYPWFMCLLFLVAGISARYALQTRDTRQFIRERVRKLIVPYFGGMFLLAWLNGWVTSRYVDLFGGHEVPGFVSYLVYCMNIGPLWFLPELFVISMLLLLIRKLDKNDKLWNYAGNVNFLLIILLALPVWGSSMILNTPVAVVFRNGIYLFVFLLGYYVFSHDAVLGNLKSHGIPLFAAALILGGAEIAIFFGRNFVSDACLQHPFTNLYLWIMILAVLGCAQRWIDFDGPAFAYMRKRSFGVYLCHYPLMIITAYFIVAYLHISMPYTYLFLLILAFGLSLLFYEITSVIPGLRLLLFGIGKKAGAGQPEKCEAEQYR